MVASVCFFQAEDGIRDLVRSRGLGDVYKRQRLSNAVVERLHDFGSEEATFHVQPVSVLWGAMAAALRVELGADLVSEAGGRQLARLRSGRIGEGIKAKVRRAVVEGRDLPPPEGADHGTVLRSQYRLDTATLEILQAASAGAGNRTS